MYRQRSFNAALILVFMFVLVLALSYDSFSKTQINTYGNSNHADLVRLFQEFRTLSQPAAKEGVPDFTAAAMKKQEEGLKKLQEQLAAMDIRDWPVAEQVDYHLVRSEMNGLEFHHWVLEPWVHNPGFYGTELITGFPWRGDGIDVFLIEFPLPDDEVAAFQAQLQARPKLFKQARQNLTDPARELTGFEDEIKKMQ